MKITTTSYNTKLIVRAATRKESGIMTITAQNINGRDSADVKVTVLDVPSAPIGPLRVKNMTTSDCNLEWKAPKDHGGMRIQYYVIEQMDESGSGRWAHVGKPVDPNSSTMWRTLLKVTSTDSGSEQLTKKENLSHLRPLVCMKPRIHLRSLPSPEDQRLLILIHHGLTWNGRDQNGMEAVPSLDTSLRKEIPTTRDGKFVPELNQKIQLVK